MGQSIVSTFHLAGVDIKLWRNDDIPWELHGSPSSKGFCDKSPPNEGDYTRSPKTKGDLLNPLKIKGML